MIPKKKLFGTGEWLVLFGLIIFVVGFWDLHETTLGWYSVISFEGFNIMLFGMVLRKINNLPQQREK